MGDTLHLPPPEPFWFVNSELLEGLLRAELSLMNHLLAHHPDLGSLLDAPVATLSERKTCFIVLAHRKMLEMVCEMFDARYEQPSLGDEESKALSATSNLVTIDAPEWVLEMDRVVQTLSFHLFGALPPALRVGRFKENSSEQIVVLGTLSTVEQLQTFIEKVFDQQSQRLEKRWSAVTTVVQLATRLSKKPKFRRTRNKQRIIRDRMIAEIDSISPTITGFLQLMDERKVKPQPTWSGWLGSWEVAYKNPRLRALIHKDKSRALTRASRHK
jgi:hypothetical protein